MVFFSPLSKDSRGTQEAAIGPTRPPVEQQSGEKENQAEHVRPARDPRYGLRLNGMKRKKQGAKC